MPLPLTKSSGLKLKITVGAEELKEKIATNTKSGKKKFDKLNLKEKLVKGENYIILPLYGIQNKKKFVFLML